MFGGEAARWVDRPNVPSKEARLRLFCFPYSGGGAQVFSSWQQRLPAAIEVCPVNLPGRVPRLNERAYTDAHALADATAKGLVAWMNRPFALYGHSFGALTAFEVARCLRRQRLPGPAHLFVGAYNAPHVPPVREPIHQLAEAQFLERIREYDGTPDDILDNKELMEMMLPALRADFTTCETYSYVEEPPLPCPITVFGGLQDSTTPRENLEAWREQTTAGFTYHMFAGGHFFLRNAEETLLWTIEQALAPLLRWA